MTIAIGPTANWLIQNQPFQVTNPFGPAGISDLTRQGWLTQLQGMGSQFGPAMQYAQGMGGLNRFAQNAFLGGMQGGQFATNPMMQQAAQMASMGGQHPGFNMGLGMLAGAPNQWELGRAGQMYGNLPGSGYFGEAAQGYRGAGQQPGFEQGAERATAAGDQPMIGQGGQLIAGAGQQPALGQGQDLIRAAPDQPGFGEAAAGARDVVSQYGGGWSNDLASDINRVGASFDPFGNPALAQSIEDANEALARDWREGTMRNLNQSAAGAGSGAFGGTRAGVAQGIAERGLADAMARQTGDMLSKGYEAGLNRMVQDRASTLGTTINALRQGSQAGIQGAQLLGQLAGQQGQLGLGAGQALGNLGLGIGNLGLGQGQALGQLGLGQGQLGLGIGQALADIAQAQGGLGMQGAQGLAGLGGTMGQLGLGAAGGMANLGLGRGNLGINAGTGIGNIANQQGGQMLQGAGLLGNLGLGGLGQQNNMFRFGFGQMLPGMMQRAYQAGLQPGQIMGNMGQAMAGMGGMQQQHNQNIIDWMNSQAAQRQQWPWQQLGRYQAAISPITAREGAMTTTTGQGPQVNPLATGMQGAATGLALYNMWRQQQGQQGGVGQGGGLGPSGWEWNVPAASSGGTGPFGY